MDDGEYMNKALQLARAAAEAGEVPVGALVVLDGEIVGEGANRTLTDTDPTAHAEVVALREAAKGLGNHRLTGATLYVTLEPCAMCAGAISHARIGRLVMGARDVKGGAVVSGPRFFEQPTCHHRPEVAELETESGKVLRDFFRALRARP